MLRRLSSNESIYASTARFFSTRPRRLYSREDQNKYIELQNTRKLSILYGKIPIIKKHRRTNRTSYIPFLLTLETRLDVILVRIHFCDTIPQARQLISHRKVYVNNGVALVTHLKLSPGDIISFKQNQEFPQLQPQTKDFGKGSGGVGGILGNGEGGPLMGRYAPTVKGLASRGVASRSMSTLIGLVPGAAPAFSGLFPNMLPLTRQFGTLPVMPIQAMTQQATRHARRVYVGGLPPSANEQVSSFDTAEEQRGKNNKILTSHIPAGCDENDILRWRNCMDRDFTINRAASRVVPLAGRQQSTVYAVAASQITRGVPLSQKIFRSSFSSAIDRISTSSHDTLIRVIDSEIVCAQDSHQHAQVEDVPENFPFKIVDEPGNQTVTLTREYQGESITVEVHMPDLVTGEENPDEDDDDSETGNRSQLPMVVRVSKHDGPCLEFGVSAYPDEISIDSLSIKDPKAGEDQIAYQGPDFNDLDEHLQKAFHKYLDMRGINRRATNFMHEYMINKDSREYVGWLKNVKKFVET